MYEVTKRIHFSYGHRLLNHAGKCARLHGHNAVAEIHCRSKTLNRNAMVVDFDEITQALKTWIMDSLDHRMILNPKDPIIPHLIDSKESYFLTDQDPTAEVLAKVIFEKSKLNGLPVYKVILWETPDSSSTYQD